MLKQFSTLLPFFLLGMISCQSKPATTDKNAGDTIATQQTSAPDAVAKLATGPVLIMLLLWRVNKCPLFATTKYATGKPPIQKC
jgi:hypothetical protein